MTYKIPLEIISIQGDGFHLMISVKMGRKKLNMLVDTGASRTVFDLTELLKKDPNIELLDLDRLSTGLGSKSVPGKLVELKKLYLGGIVINDYPAIVLDLSHLNESYRELKLPSVQGVLGSDLMMEYSASINYRKKILTLKDNKTKS